MLLRRDNTGDADSNQSDHTARLISLVYCVFRSGPLVHCRLDSRPLKASVDNVYLICIPHEPRPKFVHPLPYTEPVVPGWNRGRPHRPLGHDPLPQTSRRLPTTASLPHRRIRYDRISSFTLIGSLMTPIDPLSEALLASATAPSATTKHKTLELYNPSKVVELKYTGTLSFRWSFKWETYVARFLSFFAYRTTAHTPLPLDTNSNGNARNASSFENRTHPCSLR